MAIEGFGGAAKGQTKPNSNPDPAVADLDKLVARLAPQPLYNPKRFSQLAVGASLVLQLNGAVVNNIAGTMLTGQVSVYLGSSADLVSPPDFFFIAGSSTSQANFPANAYDSILIINSGTTAATGTVTAICY